MITQSPYTPIRTEDDRVEMERYSENLPLDYKFIEPDQKLLDSLTKG